jgi:hypothetical protein
MKFDINTFGIEPPFVEPVLYERSGPNDYGYIDQEIRNAARLLRCAAEIYSQGHYPHSNARVVSADHPLRICLQQLSILDQEMASYANCTHNPDLFKVYDPPLEDQFRWSRPENHILQYGKCYPIMVQPWTSHITLCSTGHKFKLRKESWDKIRKIISGIADESVGDCVYLNMYLDRDPIEDPLTIRFEEPNEGDVHEV